MTNYVCAYFGGTDHPDQWWTISASGFSSAKQAEKHGLYMMPTAGVFGFAVILVTENDWQLKLDYSILPPNYSIGMDSLGKFDIQPSKALEFVK